MNRANTRLPRRVQRHAQVASDFCLHRSICAFNFDTRQQASIKPIRNLFPAAEGVIYPASPSVDAKISTAVWQLEIVGECTRDMFSVWSGVASACTYAVRHPAAGEGVTILFRTSTYQGEKPTQNIPLKLTPSRGFIHL